MAASLSSGTRVCPGCGFRVTWHKSHCCAACERNAGQHGPRCDKKAALETGKEARARPTEPEGEPSFSVAGWSEVKQPSPVARALRADPLTVLFVWVERMALCVGNAGHDARNNLRFAAVALEKRQGRFLGGGGGAMGGGFGLGGVGMGGMGMMGRGPARVQENPNHPKNREPGYFAKIDNLSGQLEGLCRSIVTQARQRGRQAIRARLLPAAMGKVSEMEELTVRTEEADIDESQRTEMVRIIALQRRYLETLDASLAGSTPRPGLPKPDEVLDFSVANGEVAAQLDELAGVVGVQKASLDPQQLIMLARILCNTGHQVQNLAAFIAADGGCCDLAKKMDNLGGEIENQSRSIMVIVHRQEDTGSIPISSRQNITKSALTSLDSAKEISRLASSERLRHNASAAEMAPTLGRIHKSVTWLHDSAVLEIEQELSFGFGLFGPTLPKLGGGGLAASAATVASDDPPTRSVDPAADSATGGSLDDGSAYDVVVFGAGPAGIATAEAAIARGLRCAVVEPRRQGFGTATGFNSKVSHLAIVEGSGLYRGGGDGSAAATGGDARTRLWRDVVRQRRGKAEAYGKRTEARLREAGVVILVGCARFVDTHTIRVSNYDTGEDATLRARNVVICTGARPRHPPLCHVDGRVVHDYKTIEEVGADELPSSAAVLGGGIIAVETACHLAEFGVQTSLMAPRELLKELDPLLKEYLVQHLRAERKMEIREGCEVKHVTSDGRRAHAEFKNDLSAEADAVVVALGSVPNTEWLGIEAVSIGLTEKGAIEVDDEMRTNVPHIYACGDCCSRGGLLNLAKRQGLVAVAALHRDRNRIMSTLPSEAPSILWTVPEIATVGLRGGRTGCFDIVTRFLDCDRGILEGSPEAFFLKIVYEVQNLPSKVVVRGVHIFGTHAEKLIARGVELLGRTLDESLATSMPAAATLEELYTQNLHAAVKRTADLRSSPEGDICCTSM
eukprot:TRINITY_DN38494_c0_g1_i1.p1 TRINITY_DN38494_c0_g1~~TRINITY_DN38494_c0_g1_i1.p1  ORF type:complete len:1028 (-),score=209.98 TRINITY_DN38494_c0_g1_i1:51-2939(-)